VKENPLEAALNIATNIGTAGTVGYGEDGFGVKSGFATGSALDITKEITGANALEEANRLAREQVTEEKARETQRREDVRSQTARDQLQASRSAASVRGRLPGSRTNTQSGKATASFSILGQEERDFLWL
jgi:hypothetical protein